jgi:tetratricopeptide (TPR) repeat protein
MKTALLFLPVTLVMLTVAGLVGRALYSSEGIQQQYRVAARQAIVDEDLEGAKFYYSRLVGGGDRGTPQDQFNWVSVLQASGESQAAQQQLSELAPDDESGYGPAHTAKAQWMMSMLAQPDIDKAKMLPQIEHHLQQGAWNESAENDVLWARYYLAADKPDEAMERFFAAAARRPSLWFDVVVLCRGMGLDTEMQRAMQNAESYARSRLKQDAGDVQERLRLASLMTERKQTEAVRRLLVDGLRSTPNSPDLKRAASTFALMQLPNIPADAADAVEKRIGLIQEAANLDPNNQQIYQSLQALYGEARDDKQRAAYRKTLESMIVDGRDASAAHFALGNLTFMSGEVDTSIFHLETALELNPKAAVLANNLAWVLCQGGSPDLDRASQLAELALATNPDSISFVDTLAAVRCRQERYREAIPMLEKILPMAGGQKKRDLHKQLAAAYDSLGQESLADRHRERSGKE